MQKRPEWMMRRCTECCQGRNSLKNTDAMRQLGSPTHEIADFQVVSLYDGNCMLGLIAKTTPEEVLQWKSFDL